MSCRCGHVSRSLPWRAAADDQWEQVELSEWRLVGPRLAGVIVFLALRMRLSRARIRELLMEMFDLTLSTGVIDETIREAGRASFPLEDALVADIVQAAQLHVDETSWPESGVLHWLGIKPSYSRPRVSDDNAYAEALFRTAKYRPEFPARGFESIDQARLWGSDFVRWYNTEHRHSGIRYVTPEQRHAGDDEPLLAARHLLYQAARAKNPARWSRQTRNWSPIAAVTLNPERDGVLAAVTSTSKNMPLAA